MFPIDNTLDLIALCIAGGVAIVLVLLAYKAS